ncbi:DUF7594 domain-containing protein [Actomonas aquatica]|uniref:DNRLRE domain-containing protein n=1 Tax=Actomonas aquatica TaxID=2866162 RepID=A0ABZ1C969_9BACT|nr:DNRLRE domain-containing protein [Opitutus sp. WL0086]WRQ87905.1 DNRLRE domain-containing protein [Opitutus sp. WL0086]
MKTPFLAGRRGRFGGLCATLLASVLFAGAAVDKPTGVFSSSGANTSAIYDNDTLRGVLVRASWSDLEATDDSFDFSIIDAQVSAIQAEGKSWSLAVLAGGTGSPAWLTDSVGSGGLGAPYVTYAFRGVPGYKLPLFWDATVQAELEELADELAAEYNNDSSLKLVYVTQMTANGIEGHLQGVNMADMVTAGYTDQKWIDAGIDVSVNFANAFTNKALAFEVHEVNNTATVPETIINDLWDDPALEQRVGAAMWWISGKTSYQPDLVDVLDDFPGDIYGQIIGKSYDGAWEPNTAYADRTHRMPTNPPATDRYRYRVTTAGTSGSTEPTWPTTVGATVSDGTVVWTCIASRFEDGDYTTVFDQAMALGMRYIEPWEYEFKDSSANGAAPTWDSMFEDYNEWADEVFLAPAAPTGLSASTAAGLVSLDWNDNGETDLAGYLVYRATTSGGPYTEISGSIVTSSDYDDTTVSGGTTYYYTTTAVDDYANESAYATEVSATPPVSSSSEDFAPVADAYVNEANATANYGSNTVLNVMDATNDRRTFLKFTVSGVGTVTSATLKLKCKATQSGTTSAYQVTDITWAEGGLNWNNQPTIGSVADVATNVAAEAWVELDVTSLITGNGTFSIALQGSSSSLVQYYSSNSSGTSNDPVLEVTHN